MGIGAPRSGGSISAIGAGIQEFGFRTRARRVSPPSLMRALVACALLASLLCTSSSTSHQDRQQLHGARRLGAEQQQQAQAVVADSPDPVAADAMPKIRAYAAALDPELMQHAAPDAAYDPKYRNPCWKDASSNQLRCLPYAYILGSFHSGVTSLATKVSRHPGILTDAMSHAQFWAEDGKKMKDFVEGFSGAAQTISTNPDKIILEDSQSTLAFYVAAGSKAHRHFASTMSPCWRNCSESREEGMEPVASTDKCMGSRCYPLAQAADKQVAKDHGFNYLRDQNIPLLMRAVYGAKLPRLVAVLRDPVDRIHSAYYGYPHYYSKHGPNPAGFLSYLKEQTAAFHSCELRHGLGGRSPDECALLFELLGVPEEKVYFHCDQLMRGMYAVFLERWLAYFPRSSLLVIKAEDMFQDQRKTLESIFSFFGLPSPDEATWDTIKFAGPPSSYARGKEMLPEARRLAVDLYRPYNVRLAKLLGDPSLEAWNQNLSSSSGSASGALG